MWIIAIIGSASSFVESTLAQIYKIKDKDGFRGGPAYYMEKGLKKRWMGVLDWTALNTIPKDNVIKTANSAPIQRFFKPFSI